MPSSQRHAFGLDWPLRRTLLLLVAVGAVAFASGVSGTFVWDDIPLIVENEQIRTLAGPARFFSTPFWNQATGERYLRASSPRFLQMYRPLVSLSYATDYYLYGYWAPGYHMTNLLLHLAVALLVFFLSRHVLHAPDAALLAALLFAVHPVLTQNVSWISGRTDVLAALFVLAAILLARHLMTPRGKAQAAATILGVALLYLAGLLCKEVAVVLPLLIIIVWRDRLTGWSWLFRLGGSSLLGLALYVPLRWSTLPSLPGPTSPSSPGVWFTALLDACRTAFEYLALLFAPLRMQLIYESSESGNAWSWMALACLLASAGVLIRWRRSAPFLVTGCLWFIVCVFPVLNALPAPTGRLPFAERYLYLPACLFFVAPVGLLVSALPASLHRRRRVSLALVIAVGLLAMVSARRAALFNDPISLWSNELSSNPGHPSVLLNLATALGKAGAHTKGLELLRKARTLSPRDPEIWNSSLFLAIAARQTNEARLAFERVTSLAPERASPYANMAVLALNQGNDEEALAMADEALTRRPRYGLALNLRGVALRRLGRLEEARETLRQATDATPHKLSAWMNLAGVEESLGHHGEASLLYQAVEQRFPHLRHPALIGQARCALAAGRKKMAIQLLERANALGRPPVTLQELRGNGSAR